MASVESSASFGPSAAPYHHSNLPASPTLTNPDMILPDYERSPSPVGLQDQMHSVWRGAQAAQASVKQNVAYNPQPHQYNNVYSPITTTTPIIYGNGTMLSDIGEVTEAESTIGRPSPPRNRYGASAPAVPSPALRVDDSEGDAALRSSPTIGKSGALGGVKKRAKAAHRERRASNDSTSTITDHDQQTPKMVVFDDFDDTISVGDSVFQGDDEESVADSYVDDASLAGGPLLSSALSNRDNGQKYSTAQLSKRAEQILANAKRRLTHMEDNLSKARSSLLVTTTTVYASSPSSPSPPIARASTALMMSTTGQGSPISAHHRSGSDNSLRIGIPVKVYPQRSSSVLGISTGPRHPGLTISRSADQLNGQFNRQRSSYTVFRELEPLGENDVSQPLRRSEFDSPSRYSALPSPTFGPPADKGLTRSASTSHIRDIKDQVNDLKGKIASLREQARMDSLKRRSLQNMRTPSPFTHAKINQWYTKTLGDSEPTPPIEEADISLWGADTTSRDRPRNGAFEGVSPLDTGREFDGLQTEDADRVEQMSPDPFEYETRLRAEDDDGDLVTENGDAEEEGAVDDGPGLDRDETVNGDDMASESGDSIYHESVQDHISHEDREDAFDYEHFFLHSAMGTISQRLARRASDASFTSEDSVETTRAPVADTETEDMEQKKAPSLARRGSDASISTMESFATATEGWVSRQESLPSRSGSADLLRQEEAGKDDDGEAAEDVTQAFPTPSSHSDAIDRPETPQTAKRATFSGIGSPSHGVSTPTGQGNTHMNSPCSVVRRPLSSTVITRPHAPSVSSFESTGTTRSFPLVNRTASKLGVSSGIYVPERRSAASEGKTTDSILLSGQTSRNGGEASTCGERKHSSISVHSTSSSTSLIEENGTTAVMETLPRDDRFLVERLVASLGRCVLGLTENSRASTEARMYRRRIDAARRILEGVEQV